ncbi:MAG: WYL domain-containing protein [Gallionella sp.]|nr:WYL domain-containing protein [Gallionella sp.]
MTNSSPDTLKRQWQMLRMIPRYPGKITATQMQRKLENEQFTVTKRTVERDLQALSDVFPLMLDDRSKPFGWSWQKDASNFNIPGLSDNEALTFAMVEQHLKTMLPTSTLSQLQPYFKAAKQHLDDIPRDGRIRSWMGKVRAVPPAQPLLPSPIDAAVQQAVYGALLADRQLDICYLKRGGSEALEYRIHPLAVVQRGPVTYLCCRVSSDERPRTFAMHRIQSVTVLDDTVEIPAGFSIDEVIESGEFGFGEGKQIRLEAIFQHGAGDHLFETPISAEQFLVRLRDGRLRLKATVADTQQLVWWLLGLADGVEVVRPSALRNRMADSIEKMSQLYRQT